MPDWKKSMQQTFEYYTVNPDTWFDEKLLQNVKSCAVTFDETADTGGSATFEADENLGEAYVRAYLVTIQNGVTEKFPLGTVMIQTPQEGYDGKAKTVSMDAYMPLVELKEKLPPYGYTIMKKQNIMDMAYSLTADNVRAPVIAQDNNKNITYDFIADTSDTWLDYLSDFIALAKYRYSIDGMGRISFSPIRDAAAMQPVWTFDDSNSSILYPEVTLERDLYGVPNVVEVVYTENNLTLYSRVVNKDDNSPISIQNRGRQVIYREDSPNITGTPTQEQLDLYAEELLREKSALEYTISYTHGYCPVRVGNCVRLNYERAGITNIKAIVSSQTIKCEPGCPVTETATFATKLWG